MIDHARYILLSVTLGVLLLTGSGCALIRAADPAVAPTEAISVSAAVETAPPCTEAPAVILGGREYAADVAKLTLSNPDVDELSRQLANLPCLKSVTLTGTLPAASRLLALKQAYPNILFVWDFDFCGIPVNTMTEAVDLSGVPIEDTAPMEELLPCFYRLERVDLSGCGISDEEMDALNRRWPDTRFIWEVAVGSSTLRTDATYFMPFQHHLPKTSATDYSGLRYCTDLVVIDFGHYYVRDLSFVTYLPNLQYLLLGDSSIRDLTPLGACTELRYLELFYNPLCDLWPLTNLTKLEDLNLGFTPRHHAQSPEEPWCFEPLRQMTWLNRLWLPGTGLKPEEQLSLQESLPDTLIVFKSTGSTEEGWRYSRNGYRQRDILGMYYLHK